MKQGTALVQCTCISPQQDEMHGKGVRVANTTKAQDKDRAEVRCTVCQRLHTVPPSRIRGG